jgi:hypothetical protein
MRCLFWRQKVGSLPLDEFGNASQSKKQGKTLAPRIPSANFHPSNIHNRQNQCPKNVVP